MSNIKRFPTKKIFIKDVPIGGDAPISVQSMTFTKTKDIEGTLNQIKRLHFAGADLVRVTISDEEDAKALQTIYAESSLPIIADIHFKHKLALASAPYVDCIRINPGNIGSKERVAQVVKACKEQNIPIRIGVNCGSLEKQFEDKYGQTPAGMVASADYNIKYLEDLGFEDIKISLKASDVNRTIEAYRLLRSKNNYPFHLGVTEAGTLFGSTIKSSIALGSLLYDGIGDTLRVSITGELEEEIKVGKMILKSLGLIQDGVNIISCPTCGRLEADLVEAVKIIEAKTKHIKEPLNLSVMGCIVNAIGEAKNADVAIAYGKDSGLIIKKGEVVASLKADKLVERFMQEVDIEIEKYNLSQSTS
jgi:(E)-4-hydroxy-3-methylbut-2-enyl-diphosphate synthase